MTTTNRAILDSCGNLPSLDSSPDEEPAHDTDRQVGGHFKPDKNDIGAETLRTLVNKPCLFDSLGQIEAGESKRDAPDDGCHVHFHHTWLEFDEVIGHE